MYAEALRGRDGWLANVHRVIAAPPMKSHAKLTGYA